MGIVAAMLHARLVAGAAPIAMVTTDNYSQNGRKFRDSVTTVAPRESGARRARSSASSRPGLDVKASPLSSTSARQRSHPAIASEMSVSFAGSSAGPRPGNCPR